MGGRGLVGQVRARFLAGVLADLARDNVTLLSGLSTLFGMASVNSSIGPYVINLGALYCFFSICPPCLPGSVVPTTSDKLRHWCQSINKEKVPSLIAIRNSL